MQITEYPHKMSFKTIEIEFSNGRKRTFPSSNFDFYVSTNELEHKSDNIIITLSDLSHSFTYEQDELNGEITCKEYLCKVKLK